MQAALDVKWKLQFSSERQLSRLEQRHPIESTKIVRTRHASLPALTKDHGIIKGAAKTQTNVLKIFRLWLDGALG